MQRPHERCMDTTALDEVDCVAHGGTTDPHVVDFSANTNPRSPPGVAGVYESALAAARRYPCDGYTDFRTAAAEYVGCDPKAVIPTAGATAGMRLLFSILVGSGDSVAVPVPSFGEYEREVRLQGGTPVRVAHDAILEVDPTDHAAVVVCTPNNPTGELPPRRGLERLAERCRDADTTLLVDEAFLDYTPQASLAGEPGVVVARSLTKVFGLPGIRAGFLVATGRLRDRLDTARISWGLSTVATEVSTHCLERTAFVERTRERVATERERIRERLETRWEVYPSRAPFLLVDAGEEDVDEILSTARERGVALRDARTFPGLDDHLRTAVRGPGDNDVLLEALGV